MWREHNRARRRSAQSCDGGELNINAAHTFKKLVSSETVQLPKTHELAAIWAFIGAHSLQWRERETAKGSLSIQ